MDAVRVFRTFGAGLIVAGALGASAVAPHTARAAEDSPTTWSSYKAIPSALTHGLAPALAS